MNLSAYPDLAKETIEFEISNFITCFCEASGFDNIWSSPIIKYADASRPEIEELKKTVCPEHFMPSDFMEKPRSIISYFLPFIPKIALSNVQGAMPSGLWGEAYVRTNKMASGLDDRIVDVVRSLGSDAAAPRGVHRISEEKIYSRWSQRHIAWIAGHGTFGINNMLIGDRGSCGRYFSVVTGMSIETDEIDRDERCLYKRNASACGVCVRRCPAGALAFDGFDRERCMRTCAKNSAYLDNPHASVCGKCAVGLPCSFQNPVFNKIADD